MTSSRISPVSAGAEVAVEPVLRTGWKCRNLAAGRAGSDGDIMKLSIEFRRDGFPDTRMVACSSKRKNSTCLARGSLKRKESNV